MNITFVKSGQVQFEEREYYIAFGRINLLLRGDLKSHTTSALTRHFTGLYIMQKKSGKNCVRTLYKFLFGKCGVYLCFNQKRNCYTVYHTEYTLSSLLDVA
ncbi:hypothetical protein T4D_15794 [Trichinella pseudospiralis]|uniref:Uncharacterized protein n=1 Tax=Trichinella pseudospiralis TaxID=6337 RepID=A0A0V1FGM9_TRIPS|nr:hypothetical protein T4D_15794 [Trichinella pseudospiralis]